MIDPEDVKPGMILISDSQYYFTVIFVKKKLPGGEYFGFMVTNEPGGGHVLAAENVRIFKEFHQKHHFDQINSRSWDNFKEWVFEWIFDTKQEVFIK